MKMIKIVSSVAAILSLASTAALAQGVPSVRTACAADMQKLCPGLSDRHAARQCMMSHVSDVSPECHSAMAAARAARAGRNAAGAPAGTPPAAGGPPDPADGPPTDGPH